MKLDAKREGIVVLNNADLNEYGDQVVGGWGTLSLAGVMLSAVGFIYSAFLPSRRAGTTNSTFAKICTDCFGLVTAGCAKSLALTMRNGYAVGTDQYDFYDVVHYRLTLGDSLNQAFTSALNRGHEP